MRLFFFFALTLHAQDLWLKIGEVRSLPAPGGRAVRVGTRGVIKVVDGETAVRVVGLKSGVSPLLIGHAHYLVHVSASAQRDFALRLREKVRSFQGLRVDADGREIVLRGRLLRFSDWLEIAALAREFQGEFLFAARPLPDVATEALDHFARLARERGFPVVHFRSDPEFIAEVPRAAGHLLESASDLFKPFGVRVRATQSQLLIEPLVRTRVILAEVSKDWSRELGLRWPTEYSAQLLPTPRLGEDLLVSLRALETAGRAQVLASPNLLCRSGSEASFHAGGSFPIRTTSGFANQVSWKNHGVLLKVNPRADFRGAISLAIETEVSLLDRANAVDGVPALKTNTARSHFDLPGKRTIAMSGLIRRESGEGHDGVPFFSDLPVLGALFSSRRYARHESELVIFVTPEIYLPETDEKIEMPEGWARDER